MPPSGGSRPRQGVNATLRGDQCHPRGGRCHPGRVMATRGRVIAIKCRPQGCPCHCACHRECHSVGGSMPCPGGVHATLRESGPPPGGSWLPPGGSSPPPGVTRVGHQANLEWILRFSFGFLVNLVVLIWFFGEPVGPFLHLARRVGTILDTLELSDHRSQVSVEAWVGEWQ